MIDGLGYSVARWMNKRTTARGRLVRYAAYVVHETGAPPYVGAHYKDSAKALGLWVYASKRFTGDYKFRG